MRQSYWCVLLASLVMACGCGPTTTNDMTQAPAAPNPYTQPLGDILDVAATTLTEDETAELMKLPEADRAPALAQKLCPITGEHLGSMGSPYKVMLGDKPYFLCCIGCEKEFLADPQTALARIGLSPPANLNAEPSKEEAEPEPKTQP